MVEKTFRRTRIRQFWDRYRGANDGTGRAADALAVIAAVVIFGSTV